MRLLVIEIAEDGQLAIGDSSDPMASWELVGISTWLQIVGQAEMAPDQSEDSDSDP